MIMDLHLKKKNMIMDLGAEAMSPCSILKALVGHLSPWLVVPESFP
jgi:hypothetical protein